MKKLYIIHVGDVNALVSKKISLPEPIVIASVSEAIFLDRHIRKNGTRDDMIVGKN